MTIVEVARLSKLGYVCVRERGRIPGKSKSLRMSSEFSHNNLSTPSTAVFYVTTQDYNTTFSSNFCPPKSQ